MLAQELVRHSHEPICGTCGRGALSPLELVQALEKCENMALKLKAAKFLKETGTNTVEEMRQWAANLMKETDHGDTTD